MRTNTANLIKECHLFSSLDIEVCEKIANLFESFEIEQDEILFKQGDPSQYLYILLSGTLFAIILASDGGKFVGSIEKGETVGELGAISGEARTLTIKAAHHSKLLKLPSEEFLKLCHQYPTIMLETIKPIISRSQKNIKLLSSEKEITYIGLIVEKSTHSRTIKNNFLKNLPKNASYAFICDSEINSKIVDKVLAEQAQKHHTVIAMLDCGESHLSKIILDKAETVYIFADGDLNDDLPPFAKSIIYKEEYRNKIKFELVLFHNDKKDFPKNTQKWLEKELFFQHHHLRVNKDNDYQRLLRFFSGNAIGFVLGGGGARGWLHMGVLKALLDAKIPIDAIGGTSIGALMGGAYLSVQEDYEQLLEIAAMMSKQAGPPYTPKDFTIPMISWLSSERVTNTLKSFTQEHLIENLWLPYFCVTSNMASYREQSHHTGSLFQKVRGSIAIPGVFPPMVIDGQMHYDGSLCNNLPVDIMRNMVGSSGKIIAVGLTSFHDKNKEYNFPPILTLKSLIAQKLRIGKELYRFPPFFDTFYSVLTFGSFTKEKENGAFADILINPNLSDYSMLNLKKYQEKELLKLGYQELVESLDSWRYDSAKGILLKK